MRKAKTGLRLLALAGILLSIGWTQPSTALTCVDYCYIQRDQCMQSCNGDLTCEKGCRRQLFQCISAC
ncbi:MAG TPA: hypothetical protein VMW27_23625 [Thermoanaerobaculia bacterium]|nr:hypothetical protein [Thermoanaerobaculia bacterium]